MKPISRTLAIWLGTIIILSGISVGMIYAVTLVSRQRAAYLDDVRSRTDFIAKELAIDLWSCNEASIAHIAQIAIDFADVRTIQILDDGGKLLFAVGDSLRPGEHAAPGKDPLPRKARRRAQDHLRPF